MTSNRKIKILKCGCAIIDGHLVINHSPDSSVGVEQRIPNPKVAGSSPAQGTEKEEQDESNSASKISQASDQG